MKVSEISDVTIDALINGTLATVTPIKRGRKAKPKAEAAAETKPRAARKAREPRTGSVGQAALDVLADNKEPMRINDILAALAKRGVEVGGQRPYATLAATIVKQPGIKSVARGLYTVASSKEAEERRAAFAAAKETPAAPEPEAAAS